MAQRNSMFISDGPGNLSACLSHHSDIIANFEEKYTRAKTRLNTQMEIWAINCYLVETAG